MLTSFVVVLVVGGTSMIKWFEAPRDKLVGEPIAVISVAPLGAADPESSGSIPSGPVDMSGTGLESVLPEAGSQPLATPVVARPEPATPEVATPIASPDSSSSSPLGDGDEESDDAFAKPLSALPAQSASDDDALDGGESPDQSDQADPVSQTATANDGSVSNEGAVAALPTSGEAVNPGSGADATESTSAPAQEPSALDGESADEAPLLPGRDNAHDLPAQARTPTAAEIPLPIPAPDHSQPRSAPDQTTTSRIDQTNILNDAEALQADDQIRIETEKRQARQRARTRQRAAARAAEARALQLAAAKAKAQASASGDWKSDVFGDN